MRSFKADLEAQIQHSGSYTIPEEMDETYIITKTGWTIWQVRATPKHIINKLKLHWHCENEQQKYIERKNNRGSKK